MTEQERLERRNSKRRDRRGQALRQRQRFQLVLMLLGVVLVAVVFGLAASLLNLSNELHTTREHAVTNRYVNCAQVAMLDVAQGTKKLELLQADGAPCAGLDLSVYAQPR